MSQIGHLLRAMAVISPLAAGCSAGSEEATISLECYGMPANASAGDTVVVEGVLLLLPDQWAGLNSEICPGETLRFETSTPAAAEIQSLLVADRLLECSEASFCAARVRMRARVISKSENDSARCSQDGSGFDSLLPVELIQSEQLGPVESREIYQQTEEARFDPSAESPQNCMP